MQNEKYTDSQVIEDIESDDEAANDKAIRYLYKRYFQMVLTYIKQNNGEITEAEDVFQEALIAFYECIKNNKFRNESGIVTYIFSTARNIWYNRIRKSKHIVNKEDMFDRADEITKEEIDEETSKNVVSKMLDVLGENCKSIISLYYFENRTMKQIMNKMGYSTEESAKSQKYKCMQKLITYLNENPKYKEILANCI